MNNILWLNLAVALGIGLLIGAERERSKRVSSQSASGGIRTFTIASLLGAVSSSLNFWLLITSILCVTLYTAISHNSQRNQDLGITTEIALTMTVILGGLAMSSPSLSAALAVTIAILLAAKEPIHVFVLSKVTKDELNDFLILAAATLIILPLVPNEFIGPFEAINPRNLWIIVILVMTISALGHLVLRWLGARIGLPIVGLISGFISSIAVINSMGQRSKEIPTLIAEAVSGATLSSLATILQLTILLTAISPPTLSALAWPLIFGGLSISLYSLLVSIKFFHKDNRGTSKATQTFSVKSALLLAAIITIVTIVSSALKTWFGQAGLVAASGIAGLADVHAPTIAVASLAAAGKLILESTAMPILVAFSANASSKAVVAYFSGSIVYFQQVTLGLIIQVLSVWVGWWIS
ncbi:MAG: MgtC/SapB family protein [Methylophilaceae bacterium]